MRKVQSGFTLIELMIVVAIIGILASIAVPQYQDFISKSEFKEVTSLASGDRKVGVELCAQETGALTTCLAGWTGRLGSIPANAAAVALQNGTVGITTAADGIITATTTANDYNNASMTYILTPTLAAGGRVTWAESGTACDGTVASFC